ncbi:MAG: N-acetylglucosamine repressor [Candidatus Omnitrophica bacterium ADurb.Bin314]|nr:MAG: N-acetylglucosamine repressor [Candidatus Omnitrophica bacterium ADurb.Bin314]HOE68930.1 ROK family transcriptional regulator [Candidatus Omnitrophota bacterium]
MIIRQMLKDRVLTDKERKNLAILEVVRKNGPISRTDISKLTELNIVTVSNYVNHYIKKGLVVEGDLDESTGGRKPVLVELNPKAGYIVGVGLNMMSMVGVLVDLEINVVTELKRERLPDNSEQVIQQMVDLAAEIIQKAEIDKSRIVGVGVGVPGIIDERGRTIRWPQSLGDKDISICTSIKDTFEKKLGIPAFVENDANAAVLGEKWLGLDRDVRHMVYMFSGVGCGILINEEIYRGATGAAGELGITSMRATRDFTQKIATQLGRWEMDIGMVRHARERLDKGEPSLIKDYVKGDLDKISFKDIVRAVKEKDALAIKVAEQAGQDLGRKIAFIVNLLNPEVVVIGGGIEDCGAALLDAVKSTVKEWAVEEAATQVKVIPSAFGENAVALGVVGIVAREVFAQA